MLNKEKDENAIPETRRKEEKKVLSLFMNHDLFPNFLITNLLIKKNI